MGELLGEINRARAIARSCGALSMPAVAPYAWNTLLAAASERHSRDMARYNWFDHVGTDGSTFSQRIGAAGYAWSGVAENIGAGSASAAATVAQWLASPPHCQALMSAVYQEVGGSCAHRGATSYGYYWTLNLGR